MILTPQEILKKHWNYTHFKNSQEEIINSVLNGTNAVVLLPTGGGKSICYQLPALMLDGICIVVSPLIALIQDQVNALNKKGIKAIALTSQLNKDEVVIAFDNLQFGRFKFLYISPEKLQSEFIKEKIKQLNVSLIAIDEAHCISEWGHDFRPSYLKLNELLKIHKKSTVIALTATATTQVLEDIKLNLNLSESKLFKSSFHRSNLIYSVISSENIFDELLFQLSTTIESSIIYVGTRKASKEIHNFLSKKKIASSYFHGGLTTEEKNISLHNWLSNKTRIMVATNAFGMGIDKPNVRLVIHLNTPNSVENYVQEAGRAGRDGLPSKSVIISNENLLFETKNRYQINAATISDVKKVYNFLNQHFRVGLGDLPTQDFNFSLQEFCYKYNLSILKTYNAIKTLDREGVLMLDENYSKKSTLKIKVSNSYLLKYINSEQNYHHLLSLILRNYGGVFEFNTIINEYFLSKSLNITKQNLINQLKKLAEKEILIYNYENSSSRLNFLVTREDKYTINSISKSIEKQNNHKYSKLNSIIEYIGNTTKCRSIQLLAYFDEVNFIKCGKCDICLQKNEKSIALNSINNQIIEQLKSKKMTSFELNQKISASKEQVLNSLKYLLENNKISINSQNQFKLN